MAMDPTKRFRLLFEVMGMSEVSGNLLVEKWVNWLYLHVLLSVISQIYFIQLLETNSEAWHHRLPICLL
jgi:hypothetical protein